LISTRKSSVQETHASPSRSRCWYILFFMNKDIRYPPR